MAKQAANFISKESVEHIKASLERFYHPSSEVKAFRYLVAVTCVLTALVLKLEFINTLGPQTPFLLFFAAITISALYGGIGPGFIASLIAGLLIGYMFLPPIYELQGRIKTAQVIVFIMEGALISGVSELRKRSEMENAKNLLKEHELVAQTEKEIKNRKRIEDELIRSRNELAVILREVDDGITVQDTTGKILFVNTMAAKLTGFESAEEFMTTPVQKLLERFEICDEEGKNFPINKLPGRVVLETSKPARAVLRFKLLKEKTERWAIVKATPIFDDKGQLQLAVNVFQDVTEQKNLDLKKDEFMSLVSHELRTPLTSLQGFTELLQKHLAGAKDEKVASYLSYMREEEARLGTMVADFLDVTRIRVGKLNLNRTHFRFDEFVKETILSARFLSTEHNIIIKNNVRTLVFGDRVRLAQVVTNFLTNAMKYSPGAKKIIVACKKTKNTIILSVQDFGIGITPADQKEIFSLFYQSDDPARPSRGLGIGLYISAEIIKRHNGDIWVESVKGKGSTFYFSLPLEKTKIETT